MRRLGAPRNRRGPRTLSAGNDGETTQMMQRAKAFASVGAALALSMGALAACGDREAES